MKVSLSLRAMLLALALVGWMASPALAEPTVLSTDPEAGAEMHEPPSSVSMEFSEPLQSTSGLDVIDGCGTKVSEGKATIGGTAMNEMSIAIGVAPHHGTYTVEYVATGVTGTATGSFTFVVHGGSACNGSGGGGHGGHGGGGSGGGSGGGDHDGHGGGTGSGGGDHSGMDHDSDGDHETTGDHAGMDMSGHDKKNMDHKKMDHGKHRNHNKKKGDRTGDGQPPIALDDFDPPTDIPTGTTVFVALGLAIGLGLIGGWVLRVSAPS